MKKKLVVLHSSSVVVKPIAEIINKTIPNIVVLNMVDEAISHILLCERKLTHEVIKRVCKLIMLAEETGADAILLTCSTISPCVDVARSFVAPPIIKIDEAMIEKAISGCSAGGTVGVVATSFTTIDSTCTLIQQKAKEIGKRLSIKTVLNEDALAVLKTGDQTKHDELVLEEIEKISRSADVAVLAQASLNHLAEKGRNKLQIPIFGCSGFAVEEARKLLS